MPRKRVDVEKGLLSKGFRKRDGDHHYYLYYNTAGKKTVVFTKTSHSHTEIGDNLMSQMARQCKLSKLLFESLVDCPLKRGEYENLLIASGHIGAV